METGPTRNVGPDFGKMKWSQEETCWICVECQSKAWSRHVVNKHNKKDCLNQPAKPSDMPATETRPVRKAAKGGGDKMTWSEEEKCWICPLCQKKTHSKKAKNNHNAKDCKNAMPQNPSWQLGWDRKTMSCRYCGQTGFRRRRNIRKHLQNKNCTKLPNWNQLFGRDPSWWQKDPDTGEMKTNRTPYDKLLNSLKATPSMAPGPSTPMSDDSDSDEDSGSSEEEENSRQPPGGHPQSRLSGSIGEGSGSGGRGQPAHSPPVLPHSLPAATAPLYPPSHPGKTQAPWTNRNPGQVRGPQPQQGVLMSHVLPANQRPMPPARMPAVVRHPDPVNRPVWPGAGRELAGQTRSNQPPLSHAVQHPPQQYDQYSDPPKHERFSPSGQWTRQQQNVDLKDSSSWERRVCVKEEDFQGKSHPDRHDNQERLVHDVYRNGDRRRDSRSLERRDLPDRHFSESMAHPSKPVSFQETDAWGHTKPDRFPAEGPVLHDRHFSESMARPSKPGSFQETDAWGHTKPDRFPAEGPVLHDRHFSESMARPSKPGSFQETDAWGHTKPDRFPAEGPVLHDRHFSESMARPSKPGSFQETDAWGHTKPDQFPAEGPVLHDRHFSESMARPSKPGSFQETDAWGHTKPDRFPAEGPVLHDRHFSESMARPSKPGSFQETDAWGHTKPDRFPAEGPVLHDRRVDSRTGSSQERREVPARHLHESMVHPATHGSRSHTNPDRFPGEGPVLYDRRGGLGRDGGQDFEEKRVASDQHGRWATSHYDPYSRYEENDLRGRDSYERFAGDDLNHERSGHLSRDGNLGRNCSAMSERHEGQSMSRRGRYSPPRESSYGDYASRGRSRSPVGRRETVYMPEGRPRYAERESRDSYRGTHGFERYPAPETHRRREHDQDRYQVAREYSGSRDRDTGLPGYQIHRVSTD